MSSFHFSFTAHLFFFYIEFKILNLYLQIYRFVSITSGYSANKLLLRPFYHFVFYTSFALIITIIFILFCSGHDASSNGSSNSRDEKFLMGHRNSIEDIDLHLVRKKYLS